MWARSDQMFSVRHPDQREAWGWARSMLSVQHPYQREARNVGQTRSDAECSTSKPKRGLGWGPAQVLSVGYPDQARTNCSWSYWLKETSWSFPLHHLYTGNGVYSVIKGGKQTWPRPDNKKQQQINKQKQQTNNSSSSNNSQQQENNNNNPRPMPVIKGINKMLRRGWCLV